MKRKLFFIIFALVLAFPALVSALCANTANDYAVEVLLNKPGIGYNLDLLKSAQNVIVNNNQYILKSNYNSAFALALEKQTSPVSGLSVKLQIPVKAKQKNVPYLKFSSTSPRSLNVSGQPNYNGWIIYCAEGNPAPQCEFKKGKTTINANRISNNYEIVIETRENLQNCDSCDGTCLNFYGSLRCINRQLENDIEDLLKHVNLILSIDEIFSSYKVINIGNSAVTDISPEINASVDWREALSQELLMLGRDSIITIGLEDITSIANLAEQGKAGQNSRIAYGENKSGASGWFYYYQLKFPELTQIESCNEFPSSLVPTGMVVLSGGEISTYYLIPIILTAVLIVLLIALIFTARFITREKRKMKIRPVIGLQSNPI